MPQLMPRVPRPDQIILGEIRQKLNGDTRCLTENQAFSSLYRIFTLSRLRELIPLIRIR